MFTSEVVGPFVLSRSQWGEACRVPMAHTGAMPHSDASSFVSSVIEDE